jgi:hypothetical protein
LRRTRRLALVASAALALGVVPSAAAAATPVCVPASCSAEGQSRSIVLKRKSPAKPRAVKRTSLRVSVKFAPKGSTPRVTVTGPKGFKRVISKSKTWRKVRPGRYTVVAAPIAGTEVTTYATFHTTKAKLRKGISGWVGVRYRQQVASSTRVADTAAIEAVTGDPKSVRDVVVNDPQALVQPGTVLAAGVGPLTPAGLLVQVESVTRSGDRTIARGGPAPLTAIGPQAEIVSEPQLSMSEAQFDAAMAGADPARPLRQAQPRFDGKPRAFAAAGKGQKGFQRPYTCTSGAKATIDGDMDFDAGTSIGLSWGGFWHPLTIYAHAGVKIKQSARIAVAIEGEAKCELELDLLPQDYRFTAWTFTVGPVPVVIVPKLNFQVTGEASVGAKISSSVEQSLNTEFGVQWDGSKLGPYGKAEASFKTYKPTPSGSLNLKAAIGPKLIFDFYDVAGPYVTADLFMQLKADTAKTPWWRLSGGLQAGGGLRFKVWDFTFDKNIRNIRSEDWTIAQADKPPVPAFTTKTLPDADNGKAYSSKVVATSSKAPLTYTLASGRLPDGLKLEKDGRLTGTATGYGARTFEVAATDSLGQKGLRTFSVTTKTPATVLKTTALPAATTGVAYSAALESAGGIAPYKWDVSAGALPAGLALAGDKLIGTPSAAGAKTFTLRVQGVDGNPATRAFTLAVEPPPLAITTTALPSGKAYVAYDQTLVAAGGVAPYTWTATALAEGLTLSPAGRLSGTPTAPSSAPVRVTVTDAGGRTRTADLALTIADVDPVAIGTASLPQGMVGVAYDQTLSASGGRAPYTWQASSGTPAGLTVSAAGQVTGTPSADGTSQLSVTATDRDGRTATRTLTLEVLPPGISITTTTLPGAQRNEAYDEALAVLGGTAPYTWSVDDGALPTGLTLDPSTGHIAGTPTVGGTEQFTVRVTGTSGGSVSKSFSITVDATVGHYLVDVSCPTANLCVALDLDGKAYTKTGTGAWSAAVDTTLSSSPYTARLSCVTETYCVATNRDGEARRFDGTAWSTLPSPPSATEIFDVDCASTTYCVAAGVAATYQTRVWKWDGSAWSAPLGTTAANGWVRVECPAVDDCVLVGNPITATFDGTTVTATNDLTNEGDSLSCIATSAECFAGRYDVGVWAFDGTAWAPTTASSNGQALQLYPVSCSPTGRFCASGGFQGGNGMWTYDGTTWTNHAGTNTGNVTEISCGSPSFCVAVTSKGQWRGWDGTSWGLLRTFARG